MSDDDKNSLKQVFTFMTVPFVLGVPPVIGWLIGSFLDRKLGTDPYLMFFFIALGFASGFLEFYKMVKRFGSGD